MTLCFRCERNAPDSGARQYLCSQCKKERMRGSIGKYRYYGGLEIWDKFLSKEGPSRGFFSDNEWYNNTAVDDFTDGLLFLIDRRKTTPSGMPSHLFITLDRFIDLKYHTSQETSELGIALFGLMAFRKAKYFSFEFYDSKGLPAKAVFSPIYFKFNEGTVQEIKSSILLAKKEYLKRMGAQGKEVFTPPSSLGKNGAKETAFVDKLEKLSALFEKGLLRKEEFEKAKKNLIG